MKTLVLLFLCLYLTACSFGSTAYKHFDYVVLWYASDYVRLDKQQKAALSSASNLFIEWHKNNELVKYQRLLNEFQNDIRQQNISPVKAQYYRQEIRRFLDNIRLYLKPKLSPLLASLSDKQYRKIVRNLNNEINDNEEQNRKLDKSLERMQERTEDWYGPLNNAQISILNDINHKRSQQRPIWQAENRAWVKAFEQASLLKGDKRTENIKQILLSSLEPTENVNYSEKGEWYAIWLLANDTQIQAILTKLSEYQELLNDINDE